MGGNKERDIVWKGDFLLLRLFLENGDASFEVRWLDISDQSPLKAIPQPLFEPFNLVGKFIGSQNDLFMRLVERIKRMEKLFLGPFSSREKLDVIDD